MRAPRPEGGRSPAPCALAGRPGAHGGRPPAVVACPHPGAGARARASARLGPGWDTPFPWVPVGPGGGGHSGLGVGGAAGGWQPLGLTVWRQPRPFGAGPAGDCLTCPGSTEFPGLRVPARERLALPANLGQQGDAGGSGLVSGLVQPPAGALPGVSGRGKQLATWLGTPVSGVCYPHHSPRSRSRSQRGPWRAEFTSEGCGLELEPSLPQEGGAEKGLLLKPGAPQPVQSGREKSLLSLPPSPKAAA